MYTTPPTRRTHHKRFSATRLSSDTTVTQLPEYYDHRKHLDPPPDYEADHSSLEMDRPSGAPLTRRVTTSGASSPRRRKHRQVSSGGDALLDALLERSVHALEMSNNLLQSSMSTQNSMARMNAVQSDSESSDSDIDIERSQTTRRLGGQEQWADDLDDISRRVDRLLDESADDDDDDENEQLVRHPRRESSISASLPTSSPMQSLAHRRKKRRPSLDQVQSTPEILPTPVSDDAQNGHLRHAPQERQHLIAPPPRALTQYITHEEANDLALPSTLGLRGSGLKPVSSTANLQAQQSSSPVVSPRLPQTPRIDGLPSSSSSSAYTILSSLVSKPSTTTPPRSPFLGLSSPTFPTFSPPTAHRSSPSVSSGPSSTKSGFSFTGLKSRRWSASSQSTARTTVSHSPSRSRRGARSTSRRGSTESLRPSRERPRSTTPARSSPSRSQTPKGHPPYLNESISTPQLPQNFNHHQPHEQPIPEESYLSSSSSSSDLHVEQTITSLRNILSSHPPPPPPETEFEELLRTRKPRFTPKTLAVQADISSSSATASVSKLFSRSSIGGKHSYSTRPDSPPKVSSLKGGRRRRDESGTSTPVSSALPSLPATPTILTTPSIDSQLPSGAVTPQSEQSSATAALVSTLPAPLLSSIPSSRRSSPGSSIIDMFTSWSTPNSGATTPVTPSSGHKKRISFAELPEGSTGLGSQSTIRGSKKKKKGSSSRRSSTSSKKGGKKGESDQEAAGSGWLSWLIPPVPPAGGHASSSSEYGAPPGFGQGSRAMMGSLRGGPPSGALGGVDDGIWSGI